jgi:hypothetical protein
MLFVHIVYHTGLFLSVTVLYTQTAFSSSFFFNICTSSDFIIICLAATLYASAYTDIIEHILSFNAYANEVRDAALM